MTSDEMLGAAGREEAVGAPGLACRGKRARASLLHLLVGIAALFSMTALRAGAVDDNERSGESSRFFDSQDGWLDVSSFLDSAHGFVPFAAPITEPAVGYGAVGTLVFIDRGPPGSARRDTRPNVAAIGAAATRNGTRALFAGHLGTWRDGRLRTLAGLADGDVNLEFFGIGADRVPGREREYTVKARGGVFGASHRLGDTPFWLGLRYANAQTQVSLGGPDADVPSIPPADMDLRLGAITPSITLDRRDNFFTPTDGWYADLSVAMFREALGSDRDFTRSTLTAIHYRPLASSLFFSMRGTGRTSTDGTPFYLRPFVLLRGVQALRYQGEQAGEFEAELRWQFHPRMSLVGFGGAGVAKGGPGARAQDETVSAAGVGFRYLVARQHGLHMGVDVAQGPDGPVLYVVFGNAWIRP